MPGHGHDAGAAVVKGERILAAVEEERLSRKKRAAGMPPVLALDEVLALSGIEPKDFDAVAVPWNPRLMGRDEGEYATEVRNTLRLQELGFKRDIPITFVNHHVAHAFVALAFRPPERARRGAIGGALMMDACGESSAGGFFKFDGKTLDLVASFGLERSPGLFYEAASVTVGFGWGKEGKTMGLASYGSPNTLRRVDYRFDLMTEVPTAATPAENLAPTIRKQLQAEILSKLGAPRTFVDKANLALECQTAIYRAIEKQIVPLLTEDMEFLCIAGGVGLNCTINDALHTLLASRGIDLIVPPACNDSGIALGAAIAASDAPHEVFADTASLGREYSLDEIGRSFAAGGLTVRPGSATQVVDRLAKGELGAWFEGRAEFGPRSLGNRCLIARPDDWRVRDRVNVAKARESWRPLAPSVTFAEFERSFEGRPSAFMSISARVREEAAGRMVGVVHVDGSARPQVVRDETSGYHSLLRHAYGAWGHESIVCTSLNSAGVPIAYTPTDAMAAARELGLDFIAGPGWIASAGKVG